MPERPIECSDCKKKTHIHYTEIVNSEVNKLDMCADCPVYKKKVDGGARVPVNHLKQDKKKDETQSLCGTCGTTLEAIQTGGNLGCQDCYTSFESSILEELLNIHALPATYNDPKLLAASLHKGKEPGEVRQIGPSAQLVALNEALDETLAKEDYEQAAWLRDQIKQLTENSNGK